jgi:hypothetical protein
MGRRKRSILARNDNLKKTKDENPAKKQKHKGMVKILEERGFQNMAKVL